MDGPFLFQSSVLRNRWFIDLWKKNAVVEPYTNEDFRRRDIFETAEDGISDIDEPEVGNEMINKRHSIKQTSTIKIKLSFEKSLSPLFSLKRVLHTTTAYTLQTHTRSHNNNNNNNNNNNFILDWKETKLSIHYLE